MSFALFDLKEWKEKHGDSLELARFAKITEELGELAQEINKEGSNKIEECLDVIQTAISYLQAIATEEEIYHAQNKYEQKLRDYEKIGRVPRIKRLVEIR